MILLTLLESLIHKTQIDKHDIYFFISLLRVVCFQVIEKKFLDVLLLINNK